MPQATFDKSRLLELFARIGETGVPIILTFLDEAGLPYPIDGIAFRMDVYKRPGAPDVMFTLEMGSGLDVVGPDLNKLRVTLTQDQATQNRDTNFYRFWAPAQDSTWLNGPFKFHNGEFDGVEITDEITVTDNGTPVTITVGIGDGLGHVIYDAGNTQMSQQPVLSFKSGLWVNGATVSTPSGPLGASEVKLGGNPLSEATVIDQDEFDLSILSNNAANYRLEWINDAGRQYIFQFGFNGFILNAQSPDDGGSFSQITLTPAQFKVDVQHDGAGLYQLNFDSLAALFSDYRETPHGLEYADNYAATFTDRSLVDKAYVDALVVGLWDDRGNHNASTNLFPATGGSGSAGAIVKGDIWTVSVAGTLGGHAVNIGDTVRALTDTPGQTDANWAIAENNIGYVPENQANKDTDGSLTANSDTNYPSQKATKTYADTKVSKTGNETIAGIKTFSSDPILDGSTASRILSTDTNKKVTALDTATYPSLTELARVKGLTSAVQTQIDGKQATLVSGMNIKTVDLISLLGSGDLKSFNDAFFVIGTNANNIINQPNSEEFLLPAGALDGGIQKINASRFAFVRLAFYLGVGSASANTPRAYIKYKTTYANGDAVGTFTTIGSGTGSDVISLTNAGSVVTNWIALPAGALADVWFCVATNGGNGSADPQSRNVCLQFREV